jgi:RimJ/RimL family protein N-acetyltransferase
MIETARLLLRPPILDDWPAWRAHQADPVTMHESAPQDGREAWANFMSAAGGWHLVGHGPLSILERDTGAWVGMTGASLRHDWPGIEVGWSLMPTWHGRGYAVEAAKATIDWFFKTFDAPRVVHTIRPGNVASRRVAEKIGSRNTGPLPEPWPPGVKAPNDLWEQTREDWARPRLVA